MKKKQNKERYVVGYRGRGQCVYGRPEKYDPTVERYANPISLLSARRILKSLPCKNKAIYRLVEVKGD